MSDGNAGAGGVVLTRLSKSYGEVRAVRSIDLTIAPGETVALLGPNGAGKTTTIDMVLGLTRPDAGTISAFGKPPAAAVRAGWVGGMLQTGSPLEHLKVGELVALMASCSAARDARWACSRPARPGDAVLLSCSDSDAALRALLGSFPGARDIEVQGGSLDEAFLELTADEETSGASTGGEAR